MKKWLIAGLLLLLSNVGKAQTTPTVAAVHGDCSQGNTNTLTQGLVSSTKMMVSYPQCTVSVFIHQGALATIYSDSNLTPLSNPFTATTNGSYTFYAAVSGRYDITLSGGQGANNSGGTGFPAPYTISDVFVGAGGGGSQPTNLVFNVPDQFPNIQAAVTNAQGNGSVPVTIAPYYVPSTADVFTNPTALRIFDFRLSGGIDSGFKRDISEWGVKSDGQVLLNGVTVTASSPTVTAAAGTFTQLDVGKVSICLACGSTTAGWAYPGSAVSGGTGGIDGSRQVHMTGGGCSVEPTGWIQIVGGTTTGHAFIPTSVGTGCSSTPTSGTVDTVTGTVTFATQPLIPSDLIAHIISVSTDGSQATLDTNVITNGFDGAGFGIQFMWGTDDTVAWQAWANSLNGNNSNSGLKYGRTTFCGFSMITASINVIGWGGELEGCGWGSFQNGMGAKLIWAGTTAGQPMLNLQNGEGARVERINFFGNRQAPPIGLQITRDATLAGAYIGSYNEFRQLWFGPMYDGTVDQTSVNNIPNMTAGIYAHGNGGNADYNNWQSIFIQNATTGYDSINPNATSWTWDQLLILYCWRGFAVVGSHIVSNSIFGGNDIDWMLGSPTSSAAGGNGTLLANNWEAESSTQMIGVSTFGTAGSILSFRRSGWQITARMHSDGKVVNMIGSLGNASLTMGNPGDDFFWSFVNYSGGPVPTIHVGNASICGNEFPFSMYESLQQGPVNVVYEHTSSPLCSGIVESPVVIDHGNTAGGSITQEIRAILAPSESAITVPYRHDYLGPFATTGYGFYAKQAQLPNANYEAVLPIAATGSTTYTYQVTCVSNGQESVPGTQFSTTTGPSTLTTTNANAVFWAPMGGCDSYNVYGNGGSGAIKQLTKSSVPLNIAQGTAAPSQAFFSATGFYDDGSYTKSSVSPPVVDNTGWINADQGYRTNGFQGLQQITSQDLRDYFTLKGSGFFSFRQAVNPFVPVYDATNKVFTPEFLFSNTTGIPNTVAGAAAYTLGHTAVASTNFNPDQLIAEPFQATTTGLLNDCQLYVQAQSPAAQVACAIYDSDGPSFTTGSGVPGGMGTPLCGNVTGITTGTTPGWTVINQSHCYVTAGHWYWRATSYSNGTTTTYKLETATGSPNAECDQTTFVGFLVWTNYITNPNAGLVCADNPNHAFSAYVDITPTPGFGTTYNASTPIPANYLGTGSTGSGTNCLKDNQTWSSCGGGGSGGPTPFTLVGAVCQGTGGSYSGSMPSGNMPTFQCVAGSTTQPQSGRALFSQASLGSTPNQWIDTQFVLPSTLTGSYTLQIALQNDVITTGTDYISFQYACSAAAATPTLSGVQSFSVAVPSPTANRFAFISTSPTISGCSAGNMMYVRIGVVTGSGTPTTNNLAIHNAILFVQ